MRKLRKPFRILLAFVISICLFLFYIHSTKEKIVASAAMEQHQNGVAISLQNPYVMPIKVYKTTVLDENEKEIPATAYSIKLSGIHSGNEQEIEQAFMDTQTDVFEEMRELTIPSDSSKKEELYSIYVTDDSKDRKTVQSADKVTVSFKVFSLIPFTTTIRL